MYADVHQGSSTVGREEEREAFDMAIALMNAAHASPCDGRQSRNAARHVQLLWGYLIKDLTHPGNDLSDELKANLISIGLWVMREADAIIAGRRSDWSPLIDINATVREGLSR